MPRSQWLIVGLCLFFAGSAVAHEEDDADELSVSGFIETSLTANLANPPTVDSKGNPRAANAYFPYFGQPLSFHLGTVHVAASGSQGKASYTVEFDAGTVAKGNAGGNLVDLQEAYVTYDFGGAKVTAGKFVTFEGIEVVESPLNPVITHGLLFWLAEPVSHVGAYATIPIGRQFEARVGVVNGWDEWDDEATSKTILGRLSGNYGYLTWGLSGTYGKESGGTDPRLSLDLTGVLTADRLTLNYQGNYGREMVDNEEMRWWGAGLQPVLALSEKVTLSARGELFKDDGGFRSGADQTLLSATGCVAYALTKTTKARCEFRLDRSNKEVFVDGEGNPTKSQRTVTVQLAQMF